MPYLDGFSNRLKLTIPNDKIDSTLTDFPVMIKLSSSSGLSGFDATPVFDELIDADKYKIAITTAASGTQCPIEIEHWDSTGKEAVLWTKIPSLYSGADTELYLYYDVTASGNDTYVGETWEEPTNDVWNSTFASVYHLAQDKSDNLKMLTTSERSGTGDPAVARGSISAVDCTGLTKANGWLVVDMACNYPGLMGSGQFELSSSGSPDSQEWGVGLGPGNLVGIGPQYKTFIFPLANATVTGGVMNVSAINFVGWHHFSDGASITIYYKNARLMWPDAEHNSILDSTSSSRHGYFHWMASQVEGKIGKCLSFDGVDDRVTTNGHTDLTSDTFSYSFWVKATTTHQIDSEANSGTAGISGQKYAVIAVGINDSGVSVGTNGISVYEHGAGYIAPTSVYSANIGTDWNHITIVYISRRSHIYLNGVLVRTGLVSGLTPVYLPYGFGGMSYGFFAGRVDEVRYFKSSLSASMIELNYYNEADQLIVYEDENQVTNWLGDWAKRIKFTTDSSKVDSALHDFPMLVTLASGTGVFDELNTPIGANFTNFTVSNSVGDGGGLDSGEIYKCSVIKDGGIYKMWYSGYNGSNWRINYCTSTDGVTWAGHQLVVANNSEGTYDTNHAYTPWVIKDGSTYKMWYLGSSGTTNSIIYCTSTDGITWANFQDVLHEGDEGVYDTADVFTSIVIKESDTSYKMWYGGSTGSGNYKILYCVSVDGINWTAHQLVMAPGGEGTYDDKEIIPDSVIKTDDGTYVMWYTGVRTAGQQAVMRAVSSDGIHWYNYELAVRYGAQGVYDTARAHRPHVMLDGGHYKMWYLGYTGSGHYTNIYCESDDCDDRHKLAITADDGTTQCPVEIEKWDAENEQAWLWTKAPVIYADRDTDFYLYYDKEQPDNSNVGDPGDSISSTVWSNDFVLVSHMHSDLIDSVLGYDGTNTGANDSVGKISYAKSFPDTTDKVTFPTTAFSDANTFTVELIATPTAETSSHAFESHDSMGQPSLEGSSANLNFWVEGSNYVSTGNLNIGEDYYIACAYDAGDGAQRLFLNNNLHDSDTYLGATSDWGGLVVNQMLIMCSN